MAEFLHPDGTGQVTGDMLQVMPTHAEMMYAPEVSGRTNGRVSEVAKREERATHLLCAGASQIQH